MKEEEKEEKADDVEEADDREEEKDAEDDDDAEETEERFRQKYLIIDTKILKNTVHVK